MTASRAAGGPEVPPTPAPPEAVVTPPEGRLPERAQVVIIGGGVNGLGVAYHLARNGVTDVLVLEGKYVPYGASGRNAGGIRAQWGSVDNVILAKHSIARWRKLTGELGFNLWFRQGGYLFLAFDEAVLAKLKETVAFHRTVGVKSRIVDETEVNILAPEVNADGLTGGMVHADDGTIFPWSVIHGYVARLKAMGVRVESFTPVTALRASGDRVTRVETSRGTVEAEWVVNAAGAWSNRVSGMVGVEMPNRPQRHEILVTEALKPFLDPMVVDTRMGMYVNQDMRGEVIAGMGDPEEPMGVNYRSSLAFTRRIARALTDLLPAIGDVRILRQWAGMYDVTPDNKPILGPTPGFGNFLQLNGASGHGFMISPATTEMVGDVILGRKPRFDLEPYLLQRFAEGRAEKDPFTIG